MFTCTQMKRLVFGWLLIFWSVAAYGAQVSFATDLANIPQAAFIWAAILSFLGGAGHSAQKMADPTTIVKSVPLELFKDTILSFLAGLITFFAAAWAGIDPLLQALAITVAGYGGSRVMEAYLDKFFNYIKKAGPSL